MGFSDSLTGKTILFPSGSQVLLAESPQVSLSLGELAAGDARPFFDTGCIKEISLRRKALSIL